MRKISSRAVVLIVVFVVVLVEVVVVEVQVQRDGEGENLIVRKSCAFSVRKISSRGGKTVIHMKKPWVSLVFWGGPGFFVFVCGRPKLIINLVHE